MDLSFFSLLILVLLLKLGFLNNFIKSVESHDSNLKRIDTSADVVIDTAALGQEMMETHAALIHPNNVDDILMPESLQNALKSKKYLEIISEIRAAPVLLEDFPNLPDLLAAHISKYRHVPIQDWKIITEFFFDHKLIRQMAILMSLIEKTLPLNSNDIEQLAQIFNVLLIINPEKVPQYFKDLSGEKLIVPLLMTEIYNAKVMKSCFTNLIKNVQSRFLLKEFGKGIALMKRDSALLLGLFDHLETKLSNQQIDVLLNLKACKLFYLMKMGGQDVLIQSLIAEEGESRDILNYLRSCLLDVIKYSSEDEKDKYIQMTQEFFSQ